MAIITTKHWKETQKVAALLASEVRGVETTHALVIALNGELGAGKTTFTQGFCRAFGVRENVTSPTFVLMKTYQLRPVQNNRHFRHLVHIDCYRIEDAVELLHLGLDDILADPDAIVLIEWANRIKNILPDDAIVLELGHGEKPNERTIEIQVDITA
ncbi:MAG: tRNA (adenosine(37)-N6)-threonylcarbamoyltransferase complex ATPase subunit type 1 TsaE [Candidatus Sungbacteria bacterium]|nr:tRNA (adenosine(37)-N6)-threonylcarbamoyltransferase complex ATPase subunit type 1 TsaE [Candidatus Sungbacteria bacterium]